MFEFHGWAVLRWPGAVAGTDAQVSAIRQAVDSARSNFSMAELVTPGNELTIVCVHGCRNHRMPGIEHLRTCGDSISRTASARGGWLAASSLKPPIRFSLHASQQSNCPTIRGRRSDWAARIRRSSFRLREANEQRRGRPGGGAVSGIRRRVTIIGPGARGFVRASDRLEPDETVFIDVPSEHLPPNLRLPNSTFVAFIVGRDLVRVETDGEAWLEIQDRIHEVLNQQWDPIGVADIVEDECVRCRPRRRIGVRSQLSFSCSRFGVDRRAGMGRHLDRGQVYEARRSSLRRHRHLSRPRHGHRRRQG